MNTRVKFKRRNKKLKYLCLAFLLLQIGIVLIFSDGISGILEIVAELVSFWITNMTKDKFYNESMEHYSKIIDVGFYKLYNEEIDFLENCSWFVIIFTMINQCLLQLRIFKYQLIRVILSSLISMVSVFLIRTILIYFKRDILQNDSEDIFDLEKKIYSTDIITEMIPDNILMECDIKAFSSINAMTDEEYEEIAKKKHPNYPFYNVVIYSLPKFDNLLAILVREDTGVELENLDPDKINIFYENLLTKLKTTSDKRLSNLDKESLKRIPVAHEVPGGIWLYDSFFYSLSASRSMELKSL